MEHDVMAIGNHEFDDGPEELIKFIDKVKTNPRLSILSCNIVVNESSQLAGKIEKSTVRVIDGVPVAIIGIQFYNYYVNKILIFDFIKL